MHLSRSVLVPLLWMILAATDSDSLCSRCACNNGTTTTPIVVTCTCNSQFQDLEFERDEIRAVKTVQKFQVKKCQSVTFNKDSFADADQLTNLLVSGAKNVVFPMGVFHSLSALFLEDIASLTLKEKAFMGVNKLTSISIKRSNISQLLEYSLYDVNDLKNLTMKNVNIEVIRSNAIRMKMAETAVVEVQDCQISTIEKGGIVLLSANTFELTGSRLGALVDIAINITGTARVQVDSNNFTTDLVDNAIAIQSHSINVTNNTFTMVPLKLLRRLQATDRGLVRFSDNTIYDLDFKAFANQMFDNIQLPEFKGNRLPCSCSTQVSYFSSLIMSTPISSILSRQNFCIAPCLISLQDFTRRQNRCKSEADSLEVLCDPSELERSSTTRSGRVLHITTTHPTLHTQPQLVTKGPIHNKQTTLSVSASLRIGAQTTLVIAFVTGLWLAI